VRSLLRRIVKSSDTPRPSGHTSIAADHVPDSVADSNSSASRAEKTLAVDLPSIGWNWRCRCKNSDTPRAAPGEIRSRHYPCRRGWLKHRRLAYDPHRIMIAARSPVKIFRHGILMAASDPVGANPTRSQRPLPMRQRAQVQAMLRRRKIRRDSHPSRRRAAPDRA
jgi:hypothetical protein